MSNENIDRIKELKKKIENYYNDCEMKMSNENIDRLCLIKEFWEKLDEQKKSDPSMLLSILIKIPSDHIISFYLNDMIRENEFFGHKLDSFQQDLANEWNLLGNDYLEENYNALEDVPTFFSQKSIDSICIKKNEIFLSNYSP